jgi:hypothetical protein
MKQIIINTDNTQITIDGKEYVLVPVEFAPGVKAELKEPELKTFEDCWNKIKPKYYINDWGYIKQISTFNNSNAYTNNQLPTEKSAKQIQAAIKLFVVKQALQGDWEPVHGLPRWYIHYDCLNTRLVKGTCSHLVYMHPYPFKSAELAQKAIDIAGDIFLEYFGVENK